MTEEEKNNSPWQPLRELAQVTPYTMGYLSLMARRGQLKVRKIGRVWHSTLSNIREFEKDMEARKRERKIQLSRQYKEKSVNPENKNLGLDMINRLAREERSVDSIDFINRQPERKIPIKPLPERDTTVNLTVNPPLKSVTESIKETDTIFDEIQKELMEVLDDIRGKEKKIRQDYLAYRENTIKSEKSDFINQESLEDQIRLEVNQNLIQDSEYLKEEERQTEEISDKLINDLGKLLDVADKAQQEAKYSILENKENESEWIPININGKTNIGIQNKSEGVLSERVFASEGKEPDFTHSREKYLADNFLNSPYNAHPFEYRRRETREPVVRRNYGQIIVILLSLILVAIAGVIFYLAEI